MEIKYQSCFEFLQQSYLEQLTQESISRSTNHSYFLILFCWIASVNFKSGKDPNKMKRFSYILLSFYINVLHEMLSESFISVWYNSKFPPSESETESNLKVPLCGIKFLWTEGWDIFPFFQSHLRGLPVYAVLKKSNRYKK